MNFLKSFFGFDAPASSQSPAEARAEWLAAMRKAVASSLSHVHGEWRDNGQVILGPGSLGVHMTQNHGGDRHVDLGFSLDTDRPECPVFWDCVEGKRGSIESAVE